MLDLNMKMMDDKERVSPDELARAVGVKPEELNRVVAENMSDMLDCDDVCSFICAVDPDAPEYWLTEMQAFFIATRIETPAAQDFTVHMIKTIVPIMRGTRNV